MPTRCSPVSLDIGTFSGLQSPLSSPERIAQPRLHSADTCTHSSLRFAPHMFHPADSLRAKCRPCSACARRRTRQPAVPLHSAAALRLKRPPVRSATATFHRYDSRRDRQTAACATQLREHGQLSLHGLTRNWPTSLSRPFESDTSPSSFAPGCVAAPATPALLAPALRPAVEESERLLKATKRNRDTAVQLRSVRAAGMRDRPSVTMLVPARLGTWPC
jgi:hypothetical protein